MSRGFSSNSSDPRAAAAPQSLDTYRIRAHSVVRLTRGLRRIGYWSTPHCAADRSHDRRGEMKKRLLEGVGAGVAFTVLALAATTVAGQSQTTARAGGTQNTGPALKTVWGEPDLQGIWSDEYQIPLERPAQFGN